MKKTIITICSVIAIITTGCNNVLLKEIGKVNMISNRNIDPNQKYTLLIPYAGGSENELKKSKVLTIEAAIDQTVKKIPGAEYLMNVKIYTVDNKFYAVQGDAWGMTRELSYYGFKVGDKVTYKSMGNFKTGTITGLKNDKTCLIKKDNGDIVEKNYDDLTKAE